MKKNYEHLKIHEVEINHIANHKIVALPLKDVGGNEKLVINFAWPKTNNFKRTVR